jgi:hypothetical protein
MIKNIFFCLLSSSISSFAMENSLQYTSGDIYSHVNAASRTKIFESQIQSHLSPHTNGWLTPNQYYIENYWSALIIRKNEDVFTFSMPVENGILKACALNADGKKLAVVGGTYLYIWDMERITDNMIYSQNLSHFSKDKKECRASLVALSNSGNRAAVQIKKEDALSQILVIDTQTKSLLYTLPGGFNSLYMLGENIVAENMQQQYDLNSCKKELLSSSE